MCSCKIEFEFIKQVGMKSNKMRGLLNILSLFRNEFDTFNNAGARILDSIDIMTLKLLWNRILVWKR